jgi:outer membrane receptor for ferric coprogen and ferric-rhodotorulic acid
VRNVSESFMRVLPVPHVLSIAVVLAASSLGQPVQAQPPGSLDATLTEIARLSRTVVSYDPQLVRGLNAPALRGVYTTDAALRAALAGSGLESTQAADGTLTLRRAPPQATTLAPVTVSGNLPPVDSSDTYVVQVTNSATRLNLSQRETPQSVTVVTRQRMDDQSMRNLDDVLQATTGISVVQSGSERSTYQARGQQIDNRIRSTPSTSPPPRSMTGSRSCAAPRACWKGPATRRPPSTWCASGPATTRRGS